MDRIEKRLILLYTLRKKHIDNVLRDFDLKYEDYQVIRALRYIDGASIHDIREEVGRHLTSTQIILESLIQKGFLQQEGDRYYLTKTVKKIYPQVKKIVKKIDRDMMDQISNKEHDEMINILDKLIEHYE